MNWRELFDETLQVCRMDPEYEQYAGREKMLAFVFTFLQQLQKQKPEYTPALVKNPLLLINASELRDLRTAFNEYNEDLLFNATNTGEVRGRPVIASFYKTILWTGFVFILNYWAHDRSANQERTDVFVEKTVHFMFDMLAPGPVDSGLDLVKFLIQLRKEK